MSKIYTTEFKLKVVQEYQKGEKGSTILGHETNIHPSMVLSWYHLYEEHGIDGLQTRRTSPSYSKEFKEKVQSELRNKVSINYLKTKYRLSPSTLKRWSVECGVAKSVKRIISREELRSEYSLNRLLNYFCMSRSTFYENLKPQKDKYKEIKSIVRAKKYNSFTGSVSGTAVENILHRDFSTTAINQKWTTDVTEFKVCGKRIYLSGIMDMHSKELIAHTVSFSPNMKLIMRMMKLAYRKTGNPKNVIIQSNQGWQYRHASYKQFLKKKKAIQSMSRKGNCLDNAVIENFWGILKTEWFYLNNFDSVDIFLEQLESYIHYFNYERNSSVLDYRTPIEVRMKSMVA